jgi:hypothetical protein
VLDATDLAGVARTLDSEDLLLRALAPRKSVALGQEEVTAVAGLHVDDVAGDADLVHGGGQDELHVAVLLSQRAVDA